MNSAVAIIFLILTLSNVVHATPPDILTSDIIMIGGSPERVVFLLATGYNLGSHYLWETKWYLLGIDLTDLTFEWQSLGGMLAADEEFGGNRFYPPEESTSIPEALSSWGAEYELRFDGSLGYTPSSPLREFYIRDSSLYVNTGNDEYRFNGVSCFDPSNLAVFGTEHQEYFMAEDSSPIREVQRLDELSRFYWSESDSIPLTPQAGIDSAELYVLVAAVADDVIPFDVIFTFPAAEYFEARDLCLEFMDEE
jgi:hypothetical protein